MYNSSNVREDNRDERMKIRDYILKCIEIAIPDGFMSAVNRNVDTEEIAPNDRDITGEQKD